MNNNIITLICILAAHLATAQTPTTLPDKPEVVLVPGGTFSIVSQNSRTIKLSSYKTKFSVPTEFEVQESKRDFWAGSSENVTFTIRGMHDDGSDSDALKSSLRTWLKDSKVKKMKSVYPIQKQYFNGFDGWGVEGEFKNRPLFALLLIHPDENVVLFVWLSYDESYLDVAKRILDSIKPL